MSLDISKFIEEFKIPVAIIPPEREYWLIRTQSGDYYDEFYHDNFIGIGWNEISDIDKIYSSPREEIIEQIIEIYETDDEDEKKPQPGRIYGSITRFLFEIKVGDVVIIPSENSSLISFGIVTSMPYIKDVTQEEIYAGNCSFKKRRNVQWLKTVKRNELDPYLYRMLQTHQAVSRSSEYSENIDRTIYSFYMKGESAHLIINVKQENNIPAMDLINCVNSVLDIVPLIKNPDSPEEHYTKDQVDLKLNIQSPGAMDFFTSYGPYIVLVLGFVVVGAMGGKIVNKMGGKTANDGSFSNETELQSDGFFEKYLKLLKHRDEHSLKVKMEEHRMYMEKLRAGVAENPQIENTDRN